MTIYFSGTTPLWEKISQIGPLLVGSPNKKKRNKNIKGQKYYIDDSLEEKNVGRVINYAEVFGKGEQTSLNTVFLFLLIHHVLVQSYHFSSNTIVLFIK